MTRHRPVKEERPPSQDDVVHINSRGVKLKRVGWKALYCIIAGVLGFCATQASSWYSDNEKVLHTLDHRVTVLESLREEVHNMREDQRDLMRWYQVPVRTPDPQPVTTKP